MDVVSKLTRSVPNFFPATFSWNNIGRTTFFAAILGAGVYLTVPAYRSLSKRLKKKHSRRGRDLPPPVFGRIKSGKAVDYQPTEKDLALRKKLASIPSKNSETRVTCLMVYPIKACGGIKVDSYVCGEMGGEIHIPYGIVRDRTWMVITKTNLFVTQRRCPRMVLISTVIEGPDVVVNAPGMPELRLPISWDYSKAEKVDTKVWGTDILAVDCGQEYGEWFSKFLGEAGLRLLFHPYEFGGRHCENQANIELWDSSRDKAAFSDLAPFLLLSEESVKDLNTHGPDKEISWLQFRPTILVSGCPPYDEDTWEDFAIGSEAQFRMTKLCTRCTVTTVDLQEATFRKDVLSVLRSYRVNQTPDWEPIYENHPLMAVNLALLRGGRIAVGDRITHLSH